jgi:hypothetical protein
MRSPSDDELDMAARRLATRLNRLLVSQPFDSEFFMDTHNADQSRAWRRQVSAGRQVRGGGKEVTPAGKNPNPAECSEWDELCW